MKQRIEALIKVVNNSTTGHLPLNERVLLLESINDASTINKIFFECVKKVYPIWEAQYPENKIMTDLLNMSNAFLYENIGNQEAFKEYDERYCTYLQSSFDGIYTLIGLAGRSLCFNIAFDAALILKIEEYDGADDNAYDYDVWNPDFLSSMAFSRGNPFIKEGDVSKRKEFWLWYLDVVSKLTSNSAYPLLDLKIPILTQEVDNPNFKRCQTDQTKDVQLLLDKVYITALELIANQENNLGWQKIIIENCCMKSGVSSIIRYVSEKDELIKIEQLSNLSLFSTITFSLNDIKKSMYQQYPSEGAWVMSYVTILNNGSYTITYNYDDFETFCKRAQTSQNLIQEFEIYPRIKEFTPEWWQQLLGKKAKYLK